MGVGRTFQVAATFASMTVRENVQLALLAHAGANSGIGARAADCMRVEADALLERVRMTRLADHGCATLAYGDAKRVELALALAGKPRLLLMDEPTAGMSPRSRDRLMQLAAEVARSGQIAVLFTEHDMDVVFGHADRIIVLDRGRIIAGGNARRDPRQRRGAGRLSGRGARRVGSGSHPESRASPSDRSAIRSPGSSSPMASRRHGPPASHVVAVCTRSG